MRNFVAILISFLISWYLFNLNKQMIELDLSEIKYLKLEVSEVERIIILFLTMFVGILSKTFYSELSKKNQTNNILIRTLKSKNLYKSLFISPIIFSAIYMMSERQADDLIALILSFQNGFFWRSILES